MKTRKSRTNITLFLNEIRVLPLITIEIIAIRRLQKQHFDWRYCGRYQHKSWELELDFLQQLNKTKASVLRVSTA